MFNNYKEAEAYIGELFDKFVPSQGKSENLAGELARAISRLSYRYFNDGDRLGIEYGKETCNAAGRFIIEQTNKAVSAYVHASWGLIFEDEYENKLEALVITLANYIKENYNELVNKETPDMFDSFDAVEDKDDEDEYEYDYDDEYDDDDDDDDEYSY